MDVGPSPLTAGAWVVDWQPMVSAILDDLRMGSSSDLVAGRFHAGIAEAILRVARLAGLPRVVLTGGCFQNGLLASLARQRLEEGGFTVYRHRDIPPSDGGLSLGQAVVAARRG